MAKTTIAKATLDLDCFNADLPLPYNLRIDDFKVAMQDVYDFLHDTNDFLVNKGLSRLDDTLRPANMSGFLSDMLTDSLGKHSRSLARNKFHNGHPDLIVRGQHKNDAAQSAEQGVEIKTTRNQRAAVDFHGGRNQTLAIFVYRVDVQTEPAVKRAPLEFTGVFISTVLEADFRRYERGDLGTRTSSLKKEVRAKLLESWIYRKV